MGIQNNVSNPVALDQWRQMAQGGGDARVVLGDAGSLTTQDMPTDQPDYVRQNQAAFDNLFTAIHGEAPEAEDVLRGLLETAHAEGRPLTPAIIGQALHVASDFAPPGCAALCAKWSDIGGTDVLSPRSDLGRAFQGELEVVIENRLLHQYGPTPSTEQMLAGLEQMRQDIRDAQGPCAQIKEKVDSVLRAVQEQLRFSAQVEASGNPWVNKLSSPLADAYKLVMDGQHHDRGMYHFENERGYMAGMLGALNKMLREVDQPLTADMYEALHDTAVAGVHQRDRMDGGSVLKPGYRDNEGVMFGLASNNWSLEGRDEFDASDKARDPQRWIVFQWRDSHGMPTEYLVAQAKPQHECRQKAADIIAAYHQEIQTATDEVSTLRCIAKCCQDLDQHHLFTDGNIRTAAFLTLNKLLLQNGMSPALFHDPNVLDVNSIDQIVDFIRAGQTEYQQLLSQE
ncbi:hypothetical protein [Bordetella genomosp. 13]|uniref:hypothetical protein n=1 Tax=Bordetella genomosp. 13 TaxID=463040 RepID=UPI0011A32E36|nr:hypothetical protein [Bordetella genomosp. 13]